MSVAEGAYDTGSNALTAAAGRRVPGLGELLAVNDAIGEGAAAVYDYQHGDRDGTIGHGAAAVTNLASAIPGVGTAVDIGNLGIGVLGTTGRLGAAITNEVAGETMLDPDEIPTSTADLVSQIAVGATHAIAGPQESRGTGTEQGEMLTQETARGVIPAFASEYPLTTLATNVGGRYLADEAQRRLGIGGTSTEEGSTSGNQRTLGSRAGDWIHEQLNGAPVRNRAQH